MVKQPGSEAIIVSKSKRSRGSEFLHDLITVDFEKINIYTGLRIATLIAPLLVIGLITRHESFLVILGAGYILAIDEIRPIDSRRTSILLPVSVLYASIFAIGMLISMVAADYLVVPLLALGLFFISYFRVFSKGFMTLKFAGIVFVIAIVTQGATLTLTGQASLLVFIGGLWAIFAGVIFPARRTLTKDNQSICTTAESSTTSGQIDTARQIQTFYKQSIHTLSIFSVRIGSRNHKCSWSTYCPMA